MQTSLLRKQMEGLGGKLGHWSKKVDTSNEICVGIFMPKTQL